MEVPRIGIAGRALLGLAAVIAVGAAHVVQDAHAVGKWTTALTAEPAWVTVTPTEDSAGSLRASPE